MGMRIFYSAILLILIIGIWVISYRKYKDIFSPLCIFAVMQFLRYIPGIFSYTNHMNVDLNEDNLFITFIMETLVLFAVFFGYETYKKPKKKTYILVEYSINPLKVALFAILIGAIFQVYFVWSNGGLRMLFNLNKSFGSSSSYLSMGSFLLIVGAVVLITNTDTKRTWPLIVIAVLLRIFPYIVQTRRSATLEPLLYLLLAYHYCVKRIKLRSILKPKIFIPIIIAMIFIVFAPNLRNEQLIFNVENIRQSQSSNIAESLLKEFSFVSRDTFVYNNFNSSNFYYGRTAICLILSPVPRLLFPNKPMPDDGMYLYNFIKGYYILPPNSDFPLDNSYPFSNQGSLYANFGILGLIIGCFVLGRIYARVYKRINCYRFDPFSVILYFSIVYQLEFSSLSVIQTLVPIIITYIFFKFIGQRKQYFQNKMDNT